MYIFPFLFIRIELDPVVVASFFIIIQLSGNKPFRSFAITSPSFSGICELPNRL